MKDLQDILKHKKPIIEGFNKQVNEKKIGVYFLLQKDEIVYIGKSIDIYKRLYNHKSNGIVFDFFYFLDVDKEIILDVERIYIKIFKPKHNVMHLKYNVNKETFLSFTDSNYTPKNNISTILKEKAVTKAELARQLNVKWATVNNWCTSNSISPVKLEKISKVLKVNVNELFQL